MHALHRKNYRTPLAYTSSRIRNPFADPLPSVEDRTSVPYPIENPYRYRKYSLLRQPQTRVAHLRIPRVAHLRIPEWLLHVVLHLPSSHCPRIAALLSQYPSSRHENHPYLPFHRSVREQYMPPLESRR